MSTETGLVLVLGPVGLGATLATLVRIVQLRRHRGEEEVIRDTRLRGQEGDEDAPSGRR